MNDLEMALSEVTGEQTSSENPSGFAALGLRDELLKALSGLGYEEPTPIQREAIPAMLDGADLLGQAATGTGKTAAFALPVINGIDSDAKVEITALVLVPTRELAVQVSEAINSYGAEQRVRALAVYGGAPIQKQLQALKRGVHIVVATPGRAIDHLKRRSLKMDNLKTVILDEADEMLDMGFMEDIQTILDATPQERQTVLFSATMPPRISSIAKKYQTDPVRIQIGAAEAAESKKLIRQTVYMVNRAHKNSALGRILDIEAPGSAIIFCRTRTEVDELTVVMNGRGYRAEALHGGMDQAQRDRVMGRLRDGTAELLVATDVAARGLDVDTLTHVVNYDVPAAAESYVHRIGRVGRAGREGVAITLAEPRQKRLLQNIERLTKQTFEMSKVPTVADLRARQIEMTVEAVREALASEDLEDFNSVLHALKGDDTDRNIALAALKLAHVARGSVNDQVEIPDAWSGNNRDRKNNKHDRGDRNGRNGRNGNAKFDKKGPRKPRANGDTGYVYVALGKQAGIRPGDLVGAIANEVGIPGSDIGPIRINDKFAVVGVPEKSVEKVISALSATKVRGKQAKARRYTQ